VSSIPFAVISREKTTGNKAKFRVLPETPQTRHSLNLGGASGRPMRGVEGAGAYRIEHPLDN
jgi:hypothetical protein